MSGESSKNRGSVFDRLGSSKHRSRSSKEEIIDDLDISMESVSKSKTSSKHKERSSRPVELQESDKARSSGVTKSSSSKTESKRRKVEYVSDEEPSVKKKKSKSHHKDKHSSKDKLREKEVVEEVPREKGHSSRGDNAFSVSTSDKTTRDRYHTTEYSRGSSAKEEAHRSRTGASSSTDRARKEKKVSSYERAGVEESGYSQTYKSYKESKQLKRSSSQELVDDKDPRGDTPVYHGGDDISAHSSFSKAGSDRESEGDEGKKGEESDEERRHSKKSSHSQKRKKSAVSSKTHHAEKSSYIKKPDSSKRAHASLVVEEVPSIDKEVRRSSTSRRDKDKRVSGSGETSRRYDESHVSESARRYDDSHVNEPSRRYDESHVSESSRRYDESHVSESSRRYDESHVTSGRSSRPDDQSYSSSRRGGLDASADRYASKRSETQPVPVTSSKHRFQQDGDERRAAYKDRDKDYRKRSRDRERHQEDLEDTSRRSRKDREVDTFKTSSRSSRRETDEVRSSGYRQSSEYKSKERSSTRDHRDKDGGSPPGGRGVLPDMKEKEGHHQYRGGVRKGREEEGWSRGRREGGKSHQYSDLGERDIGREDVTREKVPPLAVMTDYLPPVIGEPSPDTPMASSGGPPAPLSKLFEKLDMDEVSDTEFEDVPAQSRSADSTALDLESGAVGFEGDDELAGPPNTWDSEEEAGEEAFRLAGEKTPAPPKHRGIMESLKVPWNTLVKESADMIKDDQSLAAVSLAERFSAQAILSRCGVSARFAGPSLWRRVTTGGREDNEGPLLEEGLPGLHVIQERAAEMRGRLVTRYTSFSGALSGRRDLEMRRALCGLGPTTGALTVL